MDAFKLIQWDAKEQIIGRHRVMTFDIVTARQSKKCVVWFVGENHIFQMAAADSFNEKLAELILDHCIRIDVNTLQAGKIKVVEADFGAESKFETIAIVPPEVDLFGHFPSELRSKMYVVSPAFRSEFTDGDAANEWRHQIGRKDGWRIDLYRWDRLERTSPSWI